jgi:hypothetical protein
VTVADFTIDRPALLEINHKITTMGGGDSHRVKKKPHFVRRLSVFFGVLAASKLKVSRHKKKYWREDLGWTPYFHWRDTCDPKLQRRTSVFPILASESSLKHW